MTPQERETIMSFRITATLAAVTTLLTFGFIPTSEASRARLLTMGTGESGLLTGAGNGGSLYYEDPYNTFYNPALINQHIDTGIIEKSNGMGEAQGGFVTGLANYALGIYMNRGGALLGSGYAGSMRPIDIIFGGDTGIRWGLGVTYGRADSDNQEITTRIGFEIEDFEPFISFMAQGKAQGGAATNNHLLIGLRYRWGEWVPFAGFRQDKLSSAAVVRTTTWGLGLGRNSRIAEQITLNYALGYWNRKVGSAQAMILVPVDLSIEGDVLDWLSLRGGFGYRSHSTSALGASFHIGKLTLEWAVGNTDGTETLSGTNFSLADGFFTAASLAYKW